MIRQDSVRGSVQEYYGRVLKATTDLRTNACCCVGDLPREHRDIIGSIHPEIVERSYGCGSPVPDALEGCVVLDLGCGTGRDVYLASKLVGPQGEVIGVDMTADQLAVARRHEDYHMERFGYARSNVSFREGIIEDLTSVGIEDESVDVIISNCVINLSPDKERVFAEAVRVLKPGGELYFSDVFCDRRVPEELVDDPVLRGECLGGAMYIEDFRRMLLSIGIPDYRVVTSSPVALGDPEIEARVGMIGFMSVTVRIFKLSSLEDRCEDYGQVAYYHGTIPGRRHAFVFDNHHTFHTGRPLLVCGNTAEMVTQTRLGRHFTVAGDRSVHHGLFDCAEPTTGACGC